MKFDTTIQKLTRGGPHRLMGIRMLTATNNIMIIFYCILEPPSPSLMGDYEDVRAPSGARTSH